MSVQISLKIVKICVYIYIYTWLAPPKIIHLVLNRLHPSPHTCHHTCRPLSYPLHLLFILPVIPRISLPILPILIALILLLILLILLHHSLSPPHEGAFQ